MLAVPKQVEPRRETFSFSSSSFEFSLPVPQRKPQGETEENTALGETALSLEGPQSGALAPGPPSQRKPLLPEGSGPVVDSGEASGERSGEESVEDGSENNRGQAATARRILVECALCGYHVGIPAEFFGKTVHCPNCAGNTIFTESTLEPVKDELLDRLALETQERRALFPAPGEELGPLARLGSLVQGNAVRSFLVGVGLGLLVLLGIFGVTRYQGAQARGTAIERALEEGWRYGANVGSDLFHEPWCRDLERDPERQGERITQQDFERRAGAVRLHACE